MTDARKPYDPAWKHGFETRDGRKVTRVGTVRDRNAVVWKMEHDGEIYLTNCHGDVDGSFRGGDTPLDIFCTPAPVERPLECWVNVYSDGDWSMFDSHEDAARSGGYGRPGERIAVHMREVTSEPAAKEPGGLSAEQVTGLAAYFDQMSINCGPGECGDMMNQAARDVRNLARDGEI